MNPWGTDVRLTTGVVIPTSSTEIRFSFLVFRHLRELKEIGELGVLLQIAGFLFVNRRVVDRRHKYKYSHYQEVNCTSVIKNLSLPSTLRRKYNG